MPLAPAPLPLVELVDVVQRTAADVSLWHPHVRFDPGSRHWSRLPAPDGVDLWLLTWLPDQGTELHDHGTAAAALTVVQGSLTEVRASRDGSTTSTDLAVGTTQWVAPGVVHDVVNHSTAPAVSIHAYSPRLTTMTFWSAGPGGLTRVRTVETDEPEVAA